MVLALSRREVYEAAYSTIREDEEILTEISFAGSSGGYYFYKSAKSEIMTAAAGALERE